MSVLIEGTVYEEPDIWEDESGLGIIRWFLGKHADQWICKHAFDLYSAIRSAELKEVDVIDGKYLGNVLGTDPTWNIDRIYYYIGYLRNRKLLEDNPKDRYPYKTTEMSKDYMKRLRGVAKLAWECNF